MSWSLFNHNIMPTRFACNSFQLAADGEADLIWPCDEITGSSPYYVPELNGGADAILNGGPPANPTGNASIDTGESIITGACYDSLYHDDNALGDTGQYHARTGVAVNDEYTAGGIFLPVGHAPFWATSSTRWLHRTGPTLNIRLLRQSVIIDATNITTSIGHLDGNTYTSSVSFASLGRNWDDPIFIHTEVYENIAIAGWNASGTISMDVFIDGDPTPVISHSKYISANFAWAPSIESTQRVNWCNSSAGCYLNNAYFADHRAMDLAALKTAYDNNFA